MSHFTRFNYKMKINSKELSLNRPTECEREKRKKQAREYIWGLIKQKQNLSYEK